MNSKFFMNMITKQFVIFKMLTNFVKFLIKIIIKNIVINNFRYFLIGK